MTPISINLYFLICCFFFQFFANSHGFSHLWRERWIWSKFREMSFGVVDLKSWVTVYLILWIVSRYQASHEFVSTFKKYKRLTYCICTFTYKLFKNARIYTGWPQSNRHNQILNNSATITSISAKQKAIDRGELGILFAIHAYDTIWLNTFVTRNTKNK